MKKLVVLDKVNRQPKVKAIMQKFNFNYQYHRINS